MSNINTPTGNHAARLIKRIEQLERENTALQDLAAIRAAFIEHHRLTTPAHAVVVYTQDDLRIWEERVQRHAALDRAFVDAARAKNGGAT